MSNALKVLLLVQVLYVAASYGTTRNPFLFADTQDCIVPCTVERVKEVPLTIDQKEKKFVVGEKFDDEWTIKSISEENALILQNNKGQVCEVFCDTLTKKD